MKKQEKQRFLEKAIIETQKVLLDLIAQEERAYKFYGHCKEQVADFKNKPIVARFNDTTIKYVGVSNALSVKNSFGSSPETVKELAIAQRVYQAQLSRMRLDENVKKYIETLGVQKEAKRLCLFLTEERHKYEKYLEKTQKKLKKLTKNKSLEA